MGEVREGMFTKQSRGIVVEVGLGWIIAWLAGSTSSGLEAYAGYHGMVMLMELNQNLESRIPFCGWRRGTLWDIPVLDSVFGMALFGEFCYVFHRLSHLSLSFASKERKDL